MTVARARTRKYVYKVELSKNEKKRKLSSTRLANYFSKPSSNLFSPLSSRGVEEGGTQKTFFFANYLLLASFFLLHTLIYNQIKIPPNAIVTFFKRVGILEGAKGFKSL